MATSFWYPCFLPILAACGGPRLVVGGGGDSGCVPGVYAGTFECVAGTDASPQGGRAPLSIRLEGDRGGKTLYVAPGAKISTSQAGIVFSADLSGTLDCTTNRLEGSLQNVMSSASSFTFVVNGMGAISADYDASASPPALVAGMISPPPVSQPGLGSLSGVCTWSAALQ